MLAIIDYDAGNLGSVTKAVESLGEKVCITRDRKDILAADRVILPGVGAFADAYEKLERYELVETVKQAATSGVPFLGICLGMQILFDYSEEVFGEEIRFADENGNPRGLSLLPGSIKRIPKAEGLKIPHMGWNSLDLKEGARLFEGLPEHPFVYFVHSYYLSADRREDVAATADYGVKLDVSVERGNLFGCQFHPEKSGDVGLALLKNFISVR